MESLTAIAEHVAGNCKRGARVQSVCRDTFHSPSANRRRIRARTIFILFFFLFLAGFSISRQFMYTLNFFRPTTKTGKISVGALHDARSILALSN